MFQLIMSGTHVKAFEARRGIHQSGGSLHLLFRLLSEAIEWFLARVFILATRINEVRRPRYVQYDWPQPAIDSGEALLQQAEARNFLGRGRGETAPVRRVFCGLWPCPSWLDPSKLRAHNRRSLYNRVTHRLKEACGFSVIGHQGTLLSDFLPLLVFSVYFGYKAVCESERASEDAAASIYWRLGLMPLAPQVDAIVTDSPRVRKQQLPKRTWLFPTPLAGHSGNVRLVVLHLCQKGVAQPSAATGC